LAESGLLVSSLGSHATVVHLTRLITSGHVFANFPHGLHICVKERSWLVRLDSLSEGKHAVGREVVHLPELGKVVVEFEVRVLLSLGLGNVEEVGLQADGEHGLLIDLNNSVGGVQVGESSS